jgi:hypothetical protein
VCINRSVIANVAQILLTHTSKESVSSRTKIMPVVTPFDKQATQVGHTHNKGKINVFIHLIFIRYAQKQTVNHVEQLYVPWEWLSFSLTNHEARRTYNHTNLAHYSYLTQTSVNKVSAQSNAHTVSDWKNTSIACSNLHWEFDIHHKPRVSEVCRRGRFPIEDVLQI